LIATLKGIASLALGGAILTMVAQHSGRREGVAYIHVATTGVDVTVDDLVYRVASLEETPIVCALPPGPHALRMSRAGAALYEEQFVLEPGGELVVCAYEQAVVPRGGIDGDVRVAAGASRRALSIRPRE
jgi:hypothetical protein